MTTATAARLSLRAGELELLCGLLGLPVPPGLLRPGPTETVRLSELGVLTADGVEPGVAAGLVAACAPSVGLHLRIDLRGARLTALLGVRGEVGGSIAWGADGEVEASLWRGVDLAHELARLVPPLPSVRRAVLHAPLSGLTGSSLDAEVEELRRSVVGSLHCTAVAPPAVIGQVVWLATRSGWSALEPSEVRAGERWAVVRPVGPDDLGAAVAPLLAAGLA